MGSKERSNVAEELPEETPRPGVSRAKPPPEDDLSERGLLHDENYDRDSYDFGPPPVDPAADGPSLVAPQSDPVEEGGESQFSRENASGNEEDILRRANESRSAPQAEGRRAGKKMASTG